MEKNILKEQFKQLCNLCFQDECSKELHQEIIYIQQALKKDRKDAKKHNSAINIKNSNDEKYLNAMKQVIDCIDVFAEDFDNELRAEIEEIYVDATENFL